MQLWAVIKRNCLFHVLQHIKSLRHIRTSQFHLDGTLHRASFCGYSIFGDLDIEEETKQLYNGVIDGNRPSLARAITLVESSSTHKHQQAQLLLSLVLQYLNQHDHSESPCMPSFRLGVFIYVDVISSMSKFQTKLITFLFENISYDFSKCCEKLLLSSCKYVCAQRLYNWIADVE